jgi:hypothetical protein
VEFKRDLGAQAPDEWRDEVEQTVVPGGIFGEIVFFHKLSKTLILARPLPASLASGAGARPDHPITGHQMSHWGCHQF